MTDRFRWHPEARLFDSAGRAVPQGRATGAVLPDSAEGLAQAFDLQAFRVGAQDQPAPEPANVPVFETLTSGSTGAPRRILRSQASWTASFAVNAGFGIGPGARVAVLGRLVHSLSLYGAVEGLHLGAEVHLLEALRPDRQRKALIARRISHLYATPAQLRLLVDGSGLCPDLRLVLVGGSKLDPGLRASLQGMAPAAQVHEFYGAAETSFITLADADTSDGSVGRAYPGVEIALDPGGEVWVRSPYLFKGYASDSRALPSPLAGEGEGGGAARRMPPTPIPSPQGGGDAQVPAGGARWRDGWLSVGEIGRMDQGFLYLHGRAGRMVTVADQNVFPEEIEVLMQALPGVSRVAVLPVRDARRGHVLVAMVQGDPACEAVILAAVRERLGPLKAPKALIWQEDWPVLPSGKTDLRALEARVPWPA
jgi:long-chain acyl-CoA synthetase